MKKNIGKKIMSMVLALSMLVSFATTTMAANGTNFVDFPTGWSKDAMQYAVDNGLLNGRTETTINPGDNLTRAEMATIINRAFGAEIKADISQYKDVPSGDWYYGEIAKAVNMKTFSGSSDTEMRPNDNITREEVFTVIARAFVLETDDYTSLNAFGDAQDVSAWAKSAAAILVAKKYVNGYDDGNLHPKANITREEFAQIMYNIVKTYYIASGTYQTSGAGSSLIRATDVTLENVTIYGDLIIGDSAHSVVLKNVTIHGRLLCRGGATSVTLNKTTVGEYVVVYNVNGITHFNNYQSESAFKNMKMLTKATFRKRGSGNGSSSGDVDEVYTVSFHNGSDQTAFTTQQLISGKTLSDIGKNLNTIYAGKLETLPAYNRNELGYNNLGTTYTHDVSKEFIYESAPGVWSVFTDDTIVTENIDVYYAAKHISAEADVSTFSIPLVMEVRYDSKSRVVDSVKDSMISAGLSLDQTIVRNKVEEKISALYDKIGTETGVVDADGNIYDMDYGMKIVDVVTYEQIEGEVDNYIEGMLNGNRDDLVSVVSLLDIPSLVNTIGGRNLVEAVGISSIRSQLLSDTYRGQTISHIQTELKKPTSGTIIAQVLASGAKNTLIDSAAGENTFIVTILDTPAFRGDVLSIIKTEAKAQILSYLDKDNVRAEILSHVKTDDGFKNLVNNNVTFTNDIVETVKNSTTFTNILKGNSAYKTSVLNQIKSAKMSDIVNKLSNDAASKKEMVKQLAYPGRGTTPQAANYLTIKNAMMEIINTDANYQLYTDLFTNYPDLYDAIIMYYVDGSHEYTLPAGSDFDEIAFTGTWVPMIDDVVSQIVANFLAYTDGTKPTGYDEMQAYFNSAIEDIVLDYANGVYDTALSGTVEYELNTIINTEVSAAIKTALNDYIDPLKTLDANVQKAFDDAIIDFVKQYINGTLTGTDIINVVESNIITFIKNYYNGTSGVVADADVQNLAATVKANLVAKLKTTNVSNLQGPIETFVQDVNNSSIVDTFVATNYVTIVNAVDDNFIKGYLNTLTDGQVDSLVITYATTTTIVDHILSLGSTDKAALIADIVDFLESYQPYITFMNAFKNKEDSFEINKDNVHFVRAVCNRISGFDYEEVINTFGSNPQISMLRRVMGDAWLESIFDSAVGSYWRGLDPIVARIENEILTTPDNVSTDRYTTSMTVTINVPSVLHGLYNKYADVFRNKIINSGIYDYDQNNALQQVVNLDWFDMAIAYDPSRENAATGATGYYFRDYMEYYCYVLDTIILMDEAMCFYNRQNYTDAELVEVKKSLTDEFQALLDNFGNLSDRIENGMPIVGNYTLEDIIDKVDSLNTIADALGSAPMNASGLLQNAINSIKGILEGLGEGELPLGYTLDDLNALCTKLSDAIDAMSTGDYDLANQNFEGLINSAIGKLGDLITELDQDGSIAGKPVDQIMSKIAALNKLYIRYKAQIKDIISTAAGIDFDSIQAEVDSERLLEILFGRETENIFNVDSVMDTVADKLTPNGETGYDEVTGIYVIDKYMKDVNGNSVSLERNFY